jgi:hypothetical protein
VRHPFRRKNLSPRLIPFYCIVGIGLWLAQPSPANLALGAPFICAGSLLRAWGAGYLVKTDRLVVSGPYAHLRHPLYAGTWLLAVGFGIAAGRFGVGIVMLIFAPVFFGYYLPHKERVESERLTARYGGAYEAYRAAVPALLPSLRGFSPPADWPHETKTRWSRDRFRANNEFGTLLGVTAGAVLLAFLASSPG